ncbi:rab3 GTPase-activating protein catalytic subunit [Trichoplusia ni]|uniref:Rab3 GTPase-activating protein catalytic subunit n=1 Tax=Trichoplusia ni TaxID=7111 RepID=A0A7E5VF46_TRINI|nr:rab3 GTPase-activating protein catalytic subunit [Trichoplusia ni]
MNEEIDEFIYHQDFTTVSEWEVFTARIEEIINEWRLSKSSLPKLSGEYTKKWVSKTEEITFQDSKFTLSYHSLELPEPLEEPEVYGAESILVELHNGITDPVVKFIDDVDGSPFPVSVWYGLKRYLMLYPSNPLTNGNLIKLVMSTANIAFANTDCGVPFFVKIREHWQPTYLGFYEDSEYKISYDTIHLKRISNQCAELSGLISLFKSRISSPVALEPVVLSSKVSYELKEYDEFTWKKSTQSNEFLSIEGFDVKKLIELPFGSDKNPIQSLLLNCIWLKFFEYHSCVENLSVPLVDPTDARIWTVNLKLKDNFKCQLSELISKIMDLLDNNNLLMDTLGLSRSLGLVNPLHKITEAPITISKLVKAAMGQSRKSSDFKGPIADDLLMPLLYYVFPDAVDDDSFNYPRQLEVEFKQVDGAQKLCSYVKTSPEGGLVWRLSVTAARLYDAGGLTYLAHLWYEFSQELQYRWEHRILVPGVAEGSPNARTCLLHQKLQLLNCCIKRAQENTGSVAGNSSEDEFFDCSEGENEVHLPWDRPVGRLTRFGDATLKSGSPLYIPRTQDPAPKTEDQLEEDAELMLRLGDDAKASELRARMMSASLLSDMEAFKAANPGAELCDFVRWYSPRDWKPDDGGSLGERMLLPGNPWVETWSVARPVPASRQRRLFDETREAEQVLHFLRSRSISAVAELLLPAIFRAGALKAHEEGVPYGASTVGGVDMRRTFEIAARDLHEAEREACKVACERMVFTSSEEGKPLKFDDRKKIEDILKFDSYRLPDRREFMFSVKDSVAPQMMRVVIGSDLTIVGAFTERIVCL